MIPRLRSLMDGLGIERQWESSRNTTASIVGAPVDIGMDVASCLVSRFKEGISNSSGTTERSRR